jgi:hypothetical protein
MQHSLVYPLTFFTYFWFINYTLGNSGEGLAEGSSARPDLRIKILHYRVAEGT